MASASVPVNYDYAHVSIDSSDLSKTLRDFAKEKGQQKKR
jgi:hypothetical protein